MKLFLLSLLLSIKFKLSPSEAAEVLFLVDASVCSWHFYGFKIFRMFEVVCLR